MTLSVQRQEHYDSERKTSVLSRQTWLVHLEPPNFSHFKFRSREAQALWSLVESWWILALKCVPVKLQKWRVSRDKWKFSDWVSTLGGCHLGYSLLIGRECRWPFYPLVPGLRIGQQEKGTEDLGGCELQVSVLDKLLDKVEVLPLSLSRSQLGAGLVVHFRASQILSEF